MSKWVHASYPDLKIETKANNTMMTFKRQVNPLNLTDFRPMLHANAGNFNTEYDRYMNENYPK